MTKPKQTENYYVFFSGVFGFLFAQKEPYKRNQASPISGLSRFSSVLRRPHTVQWKSNTIAWQQFKIGRKSSKSSKEIAMHTNDFATIRSTAHRMRPMWKQKQIEQKKIQHMFQPVNLNWIFENGFSDLNVQPEQISMDFIVSICGVSAVLLRHFLSHWCLATVTMLLSVKLTLKLTISPERKEKKEKKKT